MGKLSDSVLDYAETTHQSFEEACEDYLKQLDESTKEVKETK